MTSRTLLSLSAAATLALSFAAPAFAADQTVPGAGNATAAATAAASPLVQTALQFLQQQANQLADTNLRTQTLDALFNPNTCVQHRANLTVAQKQAIVAQLTAAGLVNPADGASISGGIYAGIFPALVNDADGKNACPQLPMPWYAAPGSGNNSHHAYPGGLPVHEANNDTADINLAAEYKNVYGQSDAYGTAVVSSGNIGSPMPLSKALGQYLDPDLIIGAPLWHDWAKPMVFQWNADGTEFAELNFGGAGSTDGIGGTAGDSRTGGHHIMSIAESMARGFSPAFVITQASAHSSPTLGNEFKVVNWIRAAAIMDQIDPVATGYLTKDAKGNLRLPALRSQNAIDLLAAGQGNFLIEYQLHNLSDADFTQSIPSITVDQVVLAQLAPAFGYDPTNVVVYNTKFRNVVLSAYSAERLYAIYTTQGTVGVQAAIQQLRSLGVL